MQRHPENPEQGIFESHIHCLNRGLQQGAGTILIFEDDVIFHRFNGQTLEEALLALNGLTDWEALFFGCITNGSVRTVCRHLVKITYRCLAHGYALNRPFAERLVQEQWKGIPFDDLLRRKQKSYYALYPMCAFQGPSRSDNQTVVIDRLRRLFGGLPFIQRTNEWYQNNKILLIALHLLLVGVLAVFVFRLWG